MFNVVLQWRDYIVAMPDVFLYVTALTSVTYVEPARNASTHYFPSLVRGTYYIRVTLLLSANKTMCW